ncbi:MAG: hypothetical protein A2252_05315 [Elusimicrobia bacterium RIFOXYA2_FULL_39_19]|nr:MAG: hypothetical protein A2252_05315 [Elusimicrobia bacterium RIFOXYA2_FULL_39_19]
MKKTILVVDDAVSLCEGIQILFKDEYNVLSAFTVKQAKEIVAKQKLDLVILDCLLPDINGLDYLKEIKSQYPDLPVIFSTAVGCEGLSEIVTSYKNVIYLKKFYDIDTLTLKVKELLGEEIPQNPIVINKSPSINEDNIVVNKILEYIKEGISKELTVQSIAKYYNLTPQTLNKVFKNKTEMSLKEYINNYRIKRGAELLERTDESIEKIAKRVGLKSKVTFHKLFFNRFKMNPQKYRSKNQKIKNELPS